MDLSFLHADLPIAVSIIPAAADGLRVACILDPWTYQILRPEVRLLPLTPTNWRRMLGEGAPDLLLVSAAWESADGGFENLLLEGGARGALPDILAYANARHIPTVFWDTDDGFHAPLFAAAATRFDHIFAVSDTAVEHYRRTAGRRDAEILPHAVQPRLAHPYRDGRSYGVPKALIDGWADVLETPGAFSWMRSLDPKDIAVVETRYEIYRSKLGNMPEYKPYIRGMLDRRRLLSALRCSRALVMGQASLVSPTGQQLQALEALACGAVLLYRGTPEFSMPFDGAIELFSDDTALVTRIRELEARSAPADDITWRQVIRRHAAVDRVATICTAIGMPAAGDCTGLSVIHAPSGAEEVARIRKWFDLAASPQDELLLVGTSSHPDLTQALSVARHEATVLLPCGFGYGPELLRDFEVARRTAVAEMVIKPVDGASPRGVMLAPSEAGDMIGPALVATGMVRSVNGRELLRRLAAGRPIVELIATGCRVAVDTPRGCSPAW